MHMINACMIFIGLEDNKCIIQHLCILIMNDKLNRLSRPYIREECIVMIDIGVKLFLIRKLDSIEFFEYKETSRLRLIKFYGIDIREMKGEDCYVLLGDSG